MQSLQQITVNSPSFFKIFHLLSVTFYFLIDCLCLDNTGWRFCQGIQWMKWDIHLAGGFLSIPDWFPFRQGCYYKETIILLITASFVCYQILSVTHNPLWHRIDSTLTKADQELSFFTWVYCQILLSVSFSFYKPVSSLENTWIVKQQLIK